MKNNLKKSVVVTIQKNGVTLGEDVYLKGQTAILPLEKFDKKMNRYYRASDFKELIKAYCSPRFINKTVAPRITIKDFSEEQLQSFKKHIRAKVKTLKDLIEKQKKEDLDLTEKE